MRMANIKYMYFEYVSLIWDENENVVQTYSTREGPDPHSVWSLSGGSPTEARSNALFGGHSMCAIFDSLYWIIWHLDEQNVKKL